MDVANLSGFMVTMGLGAALVIVIIGAILIVVGRLGGHPGGQTSGGRFIMGGLAAAFVIGFAASAIAIAVRLAPEKPGLAGSQCEAELDRWIDTGTHRNYERWLICEDLSRVDEDAPGPLPGDQPPPPTF